MFDDAGFTIPENSAVDTLVGTLAATDPELDPITYSITTGVDGDGDGNSALLDRRGHASSERCR